jgi:hypothetical protein
VDTIAIGTASLLDGIGGARTGGSAITLLRRLSFSGALGGSTTGDSSLEESLSLKMITLSRLDLWRSPPF